MGVLKQPSGRGQGKARMRDIGTCHERSLSTYHCHNVHSQSHAIRTHHRGVKQRHISHLNQAKSREEAASIAKRKSVSS